MINLNFDRTLVLAMFSQANPWKHSAHTRRAREFRPATKK